METADIINFVLNHFNNLMGNVTDKNEVMRLIADFFKGGNHVLNLNDEIPNWCASTHQHSGFIEDIANKARVSGKYTFSEKNGVFKIYPLPKEKWYKRLFWLWPILTLLFTEVTAPLTREYILNKETQVSNPPLPKVQEMSDTVYLQ